MRQSERLLLVSRDLNLRQRLLLEHALRHPTAEYTITSHMNSNGIAINTARADLDSLVRRRLMTYVEVIEFEIYASLRDRREVFRHLQMSPLSRRYAPRVVNDESQLIRLDDLASSSPLPNNLPMEAALDKRTSMGVIGNHRHG